MGSGPQSLMPAEDDSQSGKRAIDAGANCPKPWAPQSTHDSPLAGRRVIYYGRAGESRIE